MYSVYVIKHTPSDEMYIGVTNDLKRRLGEHNNGNQTATHRVVGKWTLVYAEAYRSKNDACEREKRLKDHGRAKQELYKRISESPEI